jgi:hypothetical protein
MDNKTKIVLLLPLIVSALLAASAVMIPFEKSLSGTERMLLNFISSDLSVRERQAAKLSSYIKGPFHFTVKKTVVRDDKVPRIDYNDKSLSLVVISGNSKMAIIGGQVVREGDIVYGMKVSKIEPQRVLIKNKTAEWLYLEKTQ